MDKEKFSMWLQDQLAQREWTQAELARRSGVSTGQIARLMTGERGVGEQSVVAIAQALKLPPAQVFEAAGILPSKSLKDRLTEALELIFESLPEEEKDNVLEFAKHRQQIYEKKHTTQPHKTPKSTKQ